MCISGVECDLVIVCPCERVYCLLYTYMCVYMYMCMYIDIYVYSCVYMCVSIYIKLFSRLYIWLSLVVCETKNTTSAPHTLVSVFVRYFWCSEQDKIR